MLEDAGKDPIKRAELINNIVQSISVIPEAIVRDVYIKECGQLLRVEDKLLVSEVAKRREIQAEKENKPILNNPNNAPSGMPADVSAEISRRRFSRMMWKILTGPISRRKEKRGKNFIDMNVWLSRQ